jgi:hypothetical protein
MQTKRNAIKWAEVSANKPGSTIDHMTNIMADNDTTPPQIIFVRNNFVMTPLYFFCHTITPEKRTTGMANTTHIRL